MNLYIAPIAVCSKADTLDSCAALMKLGEEQGELFAAHINKLGLPNKSASSEPNILEEGVDVVICALDYLIKEGFTVEQINEKIEQKCIKWVKKIDANHLKECLQAEKCL